MRSRPDRLLGLTPSGLKTRYFPRSRIGQTLISAAPWINIVLLLFFFYTLCGKFIFQPGTVVELPRHPIAGGGRGDAAVLIKAVEEYRGGPLVEIVYFEDQRYITANPAHMTMLKDRFSALVADNAARMLTVYADRRVTVNTLSGVMDMSRSAGISSVNMATSASVEGQE